MSNLSKIAVFGGGCFWCTEAVFARLKGVKSVVPGYAGGDMENPDYEAVSTGNTGHAEVIEIKYDPEQISYADLLTVFFFEHDPTTLNRQGPDTGTQYRSVILYNDADQKKEAEDFVKALKENKAYDAPIVTEIAPLRKFFPAETYHKDYYEKNKSATYSDERGARGNVLIHTASERRRNKGSERLFPRNLYCELVIAPKIEKLEKRFGELLSS